MPPETQPHEETSLAGQAKAAASSTPAPTPAPASPAQVDPVRGQTSNGADIQKILLPKKEAPGTTTDSARRVSAGVLLDQEQKAGVEGLPHAADAAGAHADVGASSLRVGAAASAAKVQTKNESSVKPLETYQSDIEQIMQTGGVSVVSIAAAEAQRRAQRGGGQPPPELKVPLRERVVSFFKQTSMLVAGAALLVAAIAALAYVALRPTTVPVIVASAAPFIAVDDTKIVVVSLAGPSRNVLANLNSAKLATTLPLGLISRIVPVVASTTQSGEAQVALDAPTLLADIAPNIPSTLLRTLQPTYLLGVHAYDTNQPFLILRVDSYETAFSGMLSWEYWMRSDLAPLFTYTPSPRVQNAASEPATTTALAGQAGQGQATTTGAGVASTSTSTAPAVSAPAVPNFIDKIVENHDARVLQNDAGDIYLLWTFIDRNTLVITTNAATLREIISRLQTAPITPTPGQ